MKLYNGNIIKGLSKVVKNVIIATKLSEEYDIKFIEKQKGRNSIGSHNVA